MASARNRRLKRGDTHHERLRTRNAPTLAEFEAEENALMDEISGDEHSFLPRRRFWHDPYKRRVSAYPKTPRIATTTGAIVSGISEDEDWYADYLDKLCDEELRDAYFETDLDDWTGDDFDPYDDAGDHIADDMYYAKGYDNHWAD